MWDDRGERGRPTLAPALTKVDSCSQQMDWLPCIPIEREGGLEGGDPTKTSVFARAVKPLINSTSWASERDSSGPRVRTWNRICINMAREECVNNASKEFFSFFFFALKT